MRGIKNLNREIDYLKLKRRKLFNIYLVHPEMTNQDLLDAMSNEIVLFKDFKQRLIESHKLIEWARRKQKSGHPNTRIKYEMMPEIEKWYEEQKRLQKEYDEIRAEI